MSITHMSREANTNKEPEVIRPPIPEWSMEPEQGEEI